MGQGIRALAGIVGVLLLLPAVGLLLPSVADGLQTNDQLADARSVEATVLSTNATYVGGRNPRYTVEVRFRYTIDGRTYESDRYRPPYVGAGANATKYGKKELRAFRETYPQNATVTAYYFPDQPSKAFLVKEGISWYVVAIWGGLSLVVGLPGLYLLGVAVGRVEDGAREAFNRLVGFVVTLLGGQLVLFLALVGVLTVEGIVGYAILGAGLLVVGELLRYTGQMMYYGRSTSEVLGGDGEVDVEGR